MSTSLTVLKPDENPFEGISGTISAEAVRPDENLCIALVGPLKSGKSWLSCTAPAPILNYDLDNRAASIAGKAGVT